jgi:hypothetical protein
MDTINNALLDCLCSALVTRALDYYVPCGNMFNVLFMTGCRREELVSFNRWSVVDINTIALAPLKGNLQRTFTVDEVPDFWWNAVTTSTNIYEGFRISKVNYYIKQLQLMALETDGKFLLSNQFRHNYAKKLYYSGLTYEQIRVKMGENTLSVVQGYVNDAIYTQFNYFTEMKFHSSTGFFVEFTNSTYFRFQEQCTLLVSYGDLSNPLYFNYQPNINHYLPVHQFQAPFLNGTPKQVSLFFSNPLACISFYLDRIRCDGALPANLQRFTSLTRFLIRNTYAESLSDFYVVAPNLTYFYYQLALRSTLPFNLYTLPSAFFQISLNSFHLRSNHLALNSMANNLNLASNLINATSIYLFEWQQQNLPINFNPLQSVNFIWLLGARFTDNALPTDMSVCSNLTQLHVQQTDLYTYDNLQYYLNIQGFIANNNTNLETTFHASFSSLTDLKTLHFSSVYETITRVNQFINSIYTFITINATISNSSPNFRNMEIVIQGTNAIPDGTYQQPTGYIQGSNNGSPSSPLEKIWVITNQYGSTILYNS